MIYAHMVFQELAGLATLSAIARIITGANWNGPRFFGLREGEGKKGSKQ